MLERADDDTREEIVGILAELRDLDRRIVEAERGIVLLGGTARCGDH